LGRYKEKAEYSGIDDTKWNFDIDLECGDIE
jgi:hypothetical protein